MYNMSAFYSPDSLALSEVDRIPDNPDIKNTRDEDLDGAYQVNRCVSWIREHGYERVCLQFPENMLNDGISIALRLEKILERKVYVIGDAAFGSCCIDHISAEHVNGDAIIHFGYACLSHFSKIPVLYIFKRKKFDVKEFKNAVQNAIPRKHHIIIFYDVTYNYLYKELCHAFRKRSNCEVSRIELPDFPERQQEVADDKTAQLFGRFFSSPPETNVSAVFIGKEGLLLQHLAVALPGQLVDATWYRYSKTKGLKAYDSQRNKFLMRKYHQIEVVKDAEVIGILIGTLGIENYLTAIERVKHLAKRNGKKCYILAVGRPNVSKLANFPEIDVFVLIACYENVSQDFRKYYKPVVSLFEVQIALGDKPFQTDYVNDFRDVLRRNPSPIETDEESGDEADVSLTSGKIRVLQGSNSKDKVSKEIMEKDPGTMMETKGADFLANRSWKGLDPNLEKQEVAEAVMGRSGIPEAYENEHDTIKEKK